MEEGNVNFSELALKSPESLIAIAKGSGQREQSIICDKGYLIKENGK